MDIKEEHMQKLAKAFFKNLQRDNCEYGGIGVDSKRPFGNSSVEADILEIIGTASKCEMCGRESEEWSEMQYEYANKLYDNLINWLQNTYIKSL